MKSFQLIERVYNYVGPVHIFPSPSELLVCYQPHRQKVMPGQKPIYETILDTPTCQRFRPRGHKVQYSTLCESWWCRWTRPPVIVSDLEVTEYSTVHSVRAGGAGGHAHPSAFLTLRSQSTVHYVIPCCTKGSESDLLPCEAGR